MTEAQETGAPKDKAEGSFFQRTVERGKLAWDRFREGIGRLLGKADEKVVNPQTAEASEIEKKTKTEGIKTFFQKQAENFRDGMRIRGNEIQAGWYNFLAATNEARVMFWSNFFGGMLKIYTIENQAKAKERRDLAKEHKEAAKKLREKAKTV